MLTVHHFNKNDEKTVSFQILFGEDSLHDQYISRMHIHALAASDISEGKDPTINVIYHDITECIFR